MAKTQVQAAEQIQGILPVQDGGTDTNTLAANAVLLGNGTSPVQTVAAGTMGNVLTDNGTTWVSSPASGGTTQRTFAYFAS